METSKRKFGLDILRAAAAIGVVFSHGMWLIPPAGRTLIEYYYPLPALFGVELFFVLSGFLIGTILLNPKHTENFASLQNFWSRRWFRTLPNYYFIMFIGLVVTLLLGHRNEIHWRDLLDLVFLQNFAWAHSRFYNVSWSLAIEEWFYLLFPLGLIFFRHLRVPFAKAFVLVAFLFILGPTAAKLIAMHFRPDLYWDAHYRTIVIFRLDAVMFGVIAAFAKQKAPIAWVKYRYLFLLISVLILLIVVGCLDRNIKISTAAFDVGICPAITFGFAFCLPFFEQLPNENPGWIRRLITSTALYSYSIYLLHPLILDVFNEITDSHQLSLFPRYGLLVLLIILSYLLSKANYHWFEKPMMDLRDRPLKASKSRPS